MWYLLYWCLLLCNPQSFLLRHFLTSTSHVFTRGNGGGRGERFLKFSQDSWNCSDRFGGWDRVFTPSFKLRFGFLIDKTARLPTTKTQSMEFWPNIWPEHHIPTTVCPSDSYSYPIPSACLSLTVIASLLSSGTEFFGLLPSCERWQLCWPELTTGSSPKIHP